MADFHIEIFRRNETDFRLRLKNEDGSLRAERDLDRGSLDRLLAASENLYAGKPESRAGLGLDLYRWLDGPASGWLRALRDECGGYTLHITVDERLRHLPWEFLREDGRFLCAEAGLVPVRRVHGRAGHGGETANRPLRVLFMASSPEDVEPVLAFEQEEARILDATRKAGLELVVEESGSLEGLKEWIDGFPEAHFDVVHLSGHADLEDGRKPVFLCEDDRGRVHKARAGEIAECFADSGRFPRLLFLSGCRTGQAPAAGVLPSLCEALVRAGVPAVLGWALPVGDAAATLAAAECYERLANGVPVDKALDRARRALYEKNLPDWPLLRLYADASPLVPLVTPRRTPGRTRPRPIEPRRRFLDAGGKVEVCPRERFVGRRRILQKALRVLTAVPGEPERAEGVLLHGMGGLGKSSLALRLCDRMAATHEPWVWVGRIDGTALRRTIAEALADSSILADINRRNPDLPAWLKAVVETALVRPVLFVFDDFEKNLLPGERGGAWDNPEARLCLHALLEVLHRAGSESRVIVTSRYAFPLEHPDRLVPVPLAAFRDADLRKKTESLERLREGAKTPAALRTAAVELGAGNPRLLERLDAALGAAGLDHEALLKKLEATRDEFREDLLLRSLVDWLEIRDRRVLALAALYREPVPPAALVALAPDSDPARMAAPLALGLAESSRLETDERLYFVPELVADLLETELDEDTRREAVAAAAEALYRLWWTETQTPRWDRVLEIRQLALLAENAEAVARTTEWLTDRLLGSHEAAAARELCREALAVDEAPMVRLNLARAEQFRGEGEAAGEAYRLALAKLARPETGDPSERDYAALLFHAADYAARTGEMETAERHLRDAAEILGRLGDVREKAVTLFQIAQIELEREQSEQALRHLREAYEIAERMKIPDGLAAVGALYGPLLVRAGERERGLAVLETAREAAAFLGQEGLAAQLEELIGRL